LIQKFILAGQDEVLNKQNRWQINPPDVKMYKCSVCGFYNRNTDTYFAVDGLLNELKFIPGTSICCEDHVPKMNF
jgi:hypothetical protein